MDKKYYYVDVAGEVLVRASAMVLVYASSEEEAQELALKQGEANFLRDYQPINNSIDDIKVTDTKECDRVDMFFMPEWERQLWEPDYVEPEDKMDRFLRGLPEKEE